MSAASRILPLADCFCWRADMSASGSPFRYTNGVQATPIDAPVHETGDVQGGRDDAYAIANDLSCDEERVHNQSPLESAHLRFSRRPVGHLRPMTMYIPTSWYVVKSSLLASAACFCIGSWVTLAHQSAPGQLCPLWIKSRHMQCKAHVRFTPNSDRKSRHRCTQIYVRFGPIADIAPIHSITSSARTSDLKPELQPARRECAAPPKAGSRYSSAGSAHGLHLYLRSPSRRPRYRRADGLTATSARDEQQRT